MKLLLIGIGILLQCIPFVLCDPTDESWSFRPRHRFLHLTPNTHDYDKSTIVRPEQGLDMIYNNKGYDLDATIWYNKVKGKDIRMFVQAEPVTVESPTFPPSSPPLETFEFPCPYILAHFILENSYYVHFRCTIKPKMLKNNVYYNLNLHIHSNELNQTGVWHGMDQIIIRSQRVNFPLFSSGNEHYLGAVAGGRNYAWVLAVPGNVYSSVIGPDSVARLDLELVPMSGSGLDTEYELRATGNNPQEWHGWKVTSYGDAMLLHDGTYGYNRWILNARGDLQHSTLPGHYMYADGITKCYNNLNACISNKEEGWGYMECTWGELFDWPCNPAPVPGSIRHPRPPIATSTASTAAATVYEIGNEIPVVGGMPYPSTSPSLINRTMILILSITIPIIFVLLGIISIYIYHRRRIAINKASVETNIGSSTVTVTVTDETETETTAKN